MDVTKIAEALPRTMSHEMYNAALAANRQADLGGDFLIYRRVSYSPDDGNPPQWWDEERPKRSWAAKCRCTACGKTFYAGWPRRKRYERTDSKTPPGILLYEGEDGITYPGAARMDDETVTLYRDGQTALCPMCERTVTVEHRSRFKAGFYGDTARVYRVMVGNVENVGPYTALVLHMITRTVSCDAESAVTVTPLAALVVRNNGSLARFRFADGAWKPSPRMKDPCQIIYHSHEAVFGNKVGAWMYNQFPDQTGQTAEKSGLCDYLSGGGCHPALYLRVWRDYPWVENLVKAGWTFTLDDILNVELSAFQQRGVEMKASSHLPEYVAPRERSPAKLLRMTRKEVREYAPEHWRAETLELWGKLCDFRVSGPGMVGQFKEWLARYGSANLSDFLAYAETPGLSMPRLDAYLTKQNARHKTSFIDGMRLYLDYRSVLDNISSISGQPVPESEEWPSDLRAAHDRANKTALSLGVSKMAAKFAAVREIWGGLEYSDGKISALLPRDATDLVREGQTLRHCVGSYAERHCSGSLIIFIRHARRPERSWFTLNINVNGVKPVETQLHGYGNEFARGKKLRIPNRVRAFVDRWKEDVLTPVFCNVKANGLDKPGSASVQKGAAL